MKKYNSSRKSLPCKICSEIVENVGNETTAVTCYKCVMESMRSIENSHVDRKEIESNE
jgi:hypothetical protein